MKSISLYVSLVVCFFIEPAVLQADTWVEDSFEDFADGFLDASGQNLYVHRDGSIRAIHRYDLNDDGWIDLLFNSTHDDYAFIPATYAYIGDNGAPVTRAIDVEGSMDSVVDDLNRDGYPDLVFCPNPSGIQHNRRFVQIAWGGEDGWSRSRINGILPSYSVQKVAVADLNADSWPDIVVQNGSSWRLGQPLGSLLTVYWGGENGYLVKRRAEISLRNARTAVSADFDSDGARDLAVLSSDGIVSVLWADAGFPDSGALADTLRVGLSGASCMVAADATGDGLADLVLSSFEDIIVVEGTSTREWGLTAVFPAFEASSITVHDIDNDAHPDIVLSRFLQVRAAGGELTGGKDDSQQVYVLWGHAGDFDREVSTSLPAPYVTGTAVTDFDGDGYRDIVCAVHQGETTYRAGSLVYFGIGGRRFETRGMEIPTEGAYGVTAVPAIGDMPSGVVIANGKGGSLREEVPLLLYWGGPDGFDPSKRFEIPFRSGYEGTACDLNADGFVDLIACDEMHGGQGADDDPWHGANIFWGGSGGLDVESRTVLNEKEVGTSNVADLNRDGWLDIVIGQFNNSRGEPTHLIIYYGSRNGYSRETRTAIPCDGRSNSPMIADYDRDGWLDIAVNSTMSDLLRVFYGSADGFSGERRTDIPIPMVIDLDTADLNRDGWLDIVACSYMDPVNRNHDTGAVLLWGSPGGFTHWNAQWLPGITPLGPVIADWDDDGWLDIFTPHYHGELRREQVPCYLYWGGPYGYHTRDRTTLVNDSAADGLAADFNRDGRLDLAVVNHTIDGSHAGAESKIFYNGGNRFATPFRIERLPSPGAHWMWNEDMGHIYDRSFRQTYTSSVITWDHNASRCRIEATASVPEGVILSLEVRSADVPQHLDTAPWRGPKDGGYMIASSDRCLQYRAVMVSDNGDRYPVIDAVRVDVK